MRNAPLLVAGALAAGCAFVPVANPTLDLARTPRHTDTEYFHPRMKQACHGFKTDWFPKYKQ